MGSLNCVLRDEKNMNHLFQFLSALNVGAGSSATLKMAVLYLLDRNVFKKVLSEYLQIFCCACRGKSNETFPVGLI